MNELGRLGLRESTAVIFASDHGYHLGEHGFWQKSNLHEEVTRVPLIMSVPGVKPGRSRGLTELLDIFPTLSDLAGLEAPISVQGKSLVPILKDNDASVRDSALSLNRGDYSIRTSNWALMRYADKSTELYDMQADPDQFTNLVDNSDYAGTRNQLNTELDARLKAVGLDKSSSRRKKF